MLCIFSAPKKWSKHILRTLICNYTKFCIERVQFLLSCFSQYFRKFCQCATWFARIHALANYRKTENLKNTKESSRRVVGMSLEYHFKNGESIFKLRELFDVGQCKVAHVLPKHLTLTGRWNTEHTRQKIQFLWQNVMSNILK